MYLCASPYNLENGSLVYKWPCNMKEFPETDASVAPDKTRKLAVRIYVDCGPSVSPGRIRETGNDFSDTQSNGKHLQFSSVT